MRFRAHAERRRGAFAAPAARIRPAFVPLSSCLSHAGAEPLLTRYGEFYRMQNPCTAPASSSASWTAQIERACAASAASLLSTAGFGPRPSGARPALAPDWASQALSRRSRPSAAFERRRRRARPERPYSGFRASAVGSPSRPGARLGLTGPQPLLTAFRGVRSTFRASPAPRTPRAAVQRVSSATVWRGRFIEPTFHPSSCSWPPTRRLKSQHPVPFWSPRPIPRCPRASRASRYR